GDDVGAVVVQSKRQPGDPASVGFATTKEHRVTFARAYPDIDMSTVVVHHAVERNALRRFRGLFDEYELHSIENLRGIPNDVNAEIHLSAIRRSWDAFRERFVELGRQPTKQEVLDHATHIDDLYGHLFTPRER
ncbi:hypothetical protein, partial [Cellulomonas iranensis]|uniref:hypothetical protein n=1 Tax=Cellulomonas iranensis TaxID=76862 RepID=UPI001969B7CA